jgi:hypothetical protein
MHEFLKILRDLFKGRVDGFEIPIFMHWFYSLKNKRRAMSYPTSAPLNYRGRLTESKPRGLVIVLDGGLRPWRVTRDPSKMFLNGTFRLSDMQAGGFDQRTIFTHIDTGERRYVDANGVLWKMKMRNGKGKKKVARKLVKPAKREAGSGGTHAIL